MKNREAYRLDLNGQKFGEWSVVGKSERKGNSGQIYWICKCSCGKIVDVLAISLRTGTSTKCSSCAKRKHGMDGTSTYLIWAKMKSRCLSKHHSAYSAYGARGITVCDRWLKFENFLEDMGVRPEGTSLGRINNDGPYSPENCRWETPFQQARNKSNTRFIEFGGLRLPLAEWAQRIGISRKTLIMRLRNGWSVEDALTIKKASAWSGPNARKK